MDHTGAASTASDLPQSRFCLDALALASVGQATSLVNHSVRSFLFARLLVSRRGGAKKHEVDEELLFCACVLHDTGLSEGGNRRSRFEIDGADLAAEFLTSRGLPAAQVDAVWDAIALHSSPGLAERRSTLCEFTQRGIWADFRAAPEDVTDAEARAVFRAYPRLQLCRTMADAVVGQAHGHPEKAPRYSLADALIQERSGPTGLTRMEQDELSSRWTVLEADQS